MRQPLHFWVIGGDLRCRALARAIAQDGHTVHTYALGDVGSPAGAVSNLSPSETLEGVRAADCVILPLPVQKGELLNAPLAASPPPLSQVLDALAPGQLCCGGKVSPALAEEMERRGVHIVDYFAREELAVANAVPGTLAV